MDWDYRIIKDSSGILKIHQVFYQDDGTIYGMSEDDLAIEGSDMDELLFEYQSFKMAFDKPIIELSDKKVGDTQLIKREQQEPVPQIDFKFLPNSITI